MVGKVEQAKRLFTGLRRLGVPTELRLYPGEGPSPMSWTLPAYQDLIDNVETWLSRYLAPE